MADYRSIGTYELNKFLLFKLKDLMWTPTGGSPEKVFKAYQMSGGASVVPPLAQGAPLPAQTTIAGGPPFIVYGYSTGSGLTWERVREQAAYVIWDADSVRLAVIQNFMVDLLRRFEITAGEVNEFLGITSLYEFKYVQVTTATSPDAAITEQGRQKGLVVSAFEYTRDLDQRGMRV